MEALIGALAVLAVLGIGSARWRRDIREWWAFRREVRGFKRKYDF